MNLNIPIKKTLDKYAIDLSLGANVSVYYEVLGTNDPEIFHLDSSSVIYHPASLIKLFDSYLAKLKILSQVKNFNNRFEDSEDFGERTATDDVYDAIHESLMVSDNDALSLLVDFITDTSSGLRLPHEDFLYFRDRRKKITDLFHSKGYSEFLRLHTKCFSFAPYGRDEQLVFSKHGLGTNACVIEDIAKIMKDICKDFSELYTSMKRTIGNTNDEQTQFIAKGLEDYKSQIKDYYSKAGWTSKVRHDAALIRLNDNKEILLIIMTRGLSQHTDLIPELAKAITSTRVSA